LIECLELFCVAYKPVKVWEIKVEVHEEYDDEFVESRYIDSGQKALQILINAVEFKFGESGEDKGCGQMQRSACWVGARSRGTK